MKHSTAEPKPSGTIEVDGVRHDVWCHWDVPERYAEEMDRLIPTLVQPSREMTPERRRDCADFLVCVVPTLDRESLRKMRPRRLAALFVSVLPLSMVDPLAVGAGAMGPRPAAAETQESPTPETATP